MNKKILAAAIAASIAAPMAVAADVTVYGKLHNSIDWVDAGTSGNDATDIAERGSRLGFKGSEDLGNGLKANFQIEMGLTSANGSGTTAPDVALDNGRNTFVGVSGDFGEVRVGHHDTPYKMATGSFDIAVDQFGDINNVAGIQAVHGTDALAYISHDFSGFGFAVATVSGDAYALAATDKDQFAGGYSMAAHYANAGLKVVVAYEDLDDTVAAGSENNYWAVGASYTMDAFYIGALYEDREAGVTGSAGDTENWTINGKYTMGNNVIKAGYGDSDAFGSTADVDAWFIGLDHNMSKRTMVYAQYAEAECGGALSIKESSTATCVANEDMSGFQVGISHSF